jgi:Tfp pilus assembly protein PilF
MLASILLGTYTSIRVASVILATRANYSQDLEQASELYRLGMALDDENPDVRSNFGMRLFQEDKFAAAVPLLAESVRIGRAQSVDFSYLASAQSLAGDNESAERTMKASTALYPRSAFVLTRHATLLRLNGKIADADVEFERALQIDRPAANTWWMMINNGSQAATDLALKSSDYKPIMDLQPQSSMYAVLEERHVRFPAERLIFRRR